MSITAELTARMAALNAGSPALTHHFVKVHGFAMAIAEAEGLDPWTLEVLSMAALVHDIAIKPCMDAHGRCPGPVQETEGPPLAREMLASLGIPAAQVDRVCYLVGHHHTYTDVDGIDYRILLEADFLVNLHEGGHGEDAQRAAYRNIFRTEAGKRLFLTMYAHEA